MCLVDRQAIVFMIRRCSIRYSVRAKQRAKTTLARVNNDAAAALPGSSAQIRTVSMSTSNGESKINAASVQPSQIEADAHPSLLLHNHRCQAKPATTMILRSLLAAGALALNASAFLIPLEISDQVEKAKTELATLLPYKAQTVQLACPNCIFPGPEDGSDFSTDDETSIVSP